MLPISISDALFTKTQQRVLGLLYGRPDKSFYTNDIVRRAGMGRGTVRRELARMAAAGLLVVRKEGNQQHYQANPECPVYEELSGIVRKTAGNVEEMRPVDMTMSYQTDNRYRPATIAEDKVMYHLENRFLIPRNRLNALCRRYQVRKLSLFGSSVRDDFKPESDIDILVEFKPGRAPGFGGLVDLQKQLSGLFGGREVDLATPSILNNPYRKKSVLKDLKTLYAA